MMNTYLRTHRILRLIDGIRVIAPGAEFERFGGCPLNHYLGVPLNHRGLNVLGHPIGGTIGKKTSHRLVLFPATRVHAENACGGLSRIVLQSSLARSRGNKRTPSGVSPLMAFGRQEEAKRWTTIKMAASTA